MRTVWKFTIPVNVLTASFTTTFYVPIGAKRLTCREQGDSCALWFEVETEAETEARRFQIFGTGTGPIRHGLLYIGTCFFPGDVPVLHVYEVIHD